jgi:hypothetical protein
MRFDDVVKVTPTTASDDATQSQGDPSKFTPMGNGVATGGLPIMPWGGPPSRAPGYALYDQPERSPPPRRA